MSGRSSSNTSGRYGLSTPNSRSRKSAYRDSKALVKSGTPSKSSKARRSFRDVDDDATYATSFTLGDASSGDWGAFSLYCLMANGDIYSICPYLPKTSRVRRSDLETLSALISAKITYLSEPIESASSGAGALGEDEKYELEQRYALQAKWCRTLLAQDARAESSSADGEAEDEEEYMMVRFPASWRSVPLRQGPYLLQPSPRELDNSVESRATDLAYTYLSSVTPEETGHGSEDGRSGLGLGVLLIAYNDGKVDVCLDTERTEGAWGRIGENAVCSAYKSLPTDCQLTSLLPAGTPISASLRVYRPFRLILITPSRRQQSLLHSRSAILRYDLHSSLTRRTLHLASASSSPP